MTRTPLLAALSALLMFSPTSFADDEQPASAAPEAADVFKTLDKNGDGTLVSDEIGEEQRRAFDRLLRVGDADEDGKLTKAEYQAAFKPDEPVQIDQPRRRPGQQPGGGQPRFDLGRLFDQADSDGDGKVALKDLPEPMQERLAPLFDRLGKEELTKEDFENVRRMQQGGQQRGGMDSGRMFDRLDEDGDGKISLDDLPEPMQERLQPLFERLGKDELTKEDFADFRPGAGGEGRPGQPGFGQQMRPGGGDRPQMALVRLLDKDEDGQLSKSELAAIADKFDELDQNGDGQLNIGEIMGFAGRGGEGRGRDPRMNRDGARPGQRPDGDNPRRPRRPDGDDSNPE